MVENPLKVLGLKRVILLAWGALIVFGVSVLMHLYIYGMLNLSSPHLRPADGYAAVDSVLASWAESEELQPTILSPGRSDERTRDASMAEPPEGTDSDPGGELTNEESRSNSEELTEEGGDEIVGGELQHTVNDPPPAGDAASSTESTGIVEADSAAAGEEGLEPLLPFDESKLSRLVRVYEKMRPKQVAVILTTMPDRQVVTILSHMKENKAAQVLAEIEPGKAARISQALMNWSEYER